jgi:hypothetical protein
MEGNETSVKETIPNETWKGNSPTIGGYSSTRGSSSDSLLCTTKIFKSGAARKQLSRLRGKQATLQPLGASPVSLCSGTLSP